MKRKCAGKGASAVPGTGKKESKKKKKDKNTSEVKEGTPAQLTSNPR